MAGEYPKREPFFAAKYVRMLYKVCAAQTLGTLGVNLLTCIASTEDSARYRGGITFYNGQIMPLLGITQWETLNLSRQKCVDQGFLHYENGGKRLPGLYWVVVPDRFIDVDDSPMDEGTPTPAERYMTGWIDGFNCCAKRNNIETCTTDVYRIFRDNARHNMPYNVPDNMPDNMPHNARHNMPYPPTLPLSLPLSLSLQEKSQQELCGIVVPEVDSNSPERKTRTKRSYTVAFEAFWEAYPLKAGKGEAAPAYARAVKRLESQNVEDPNAYLLERAKAYADSPKGRGEKQFIKQASGWLNGDRWTDDASAWGSTAESSSPQAARSFTK